MESLTLEQAVRTAQNLKQGESLPTVMVGNTEYFPRKTVYFLSGLCDEIENTELVLAKNSREIGVRNIDKDQLDFPFLPTGIRLRFDTTTGATVTAKTGVYDDPAPAYWSNGDLTIIQDIILAQLPVSVIAPNYTVYAPKSPSDDFYPLAPFLIRPNKSFKINTSLAGAVVADQAFRLEIEGIEFVKNSRS